MAATVNITNKTYINETGILLVVDFLANIDGQVLNLRYGFDITQMNLENCQPFMEIDNTIIETWLMNSIPETLQ
jgi:hypothetical protein